MSRRTRTNVVLLAAVCAAAAVGAPIQPAAAATIVTVAADGSGNFTTVQAAVNAAPAGSSTTYQVDIKAGTYRGTVSIPSNKPNITLRGLGSSPSNTVVVENHPASQYGTSGSATVTVSSANFSASNLTFSNDYNEAANGASQAVALNLQGDKAILNNVRVLGNQDTLLLWSASTSTVARSYIRRSYIEGDVDFIFGRGTAVFDHCTIHSLSRGSSSNNGYITAAATNNANPFGFLIWGSTLTSNAPSKTVYLGRPWHPGGDVNAIGQVLVRSSTLGAQIRDDPWTDMSGFSWRDARFFEYGNSGAGATKNSNRPQMTSSQAARFTPTAYLAGSDGWNPIF